MNLPFNLQSACLLVCEKVLTEGDDVVSAIRIIDICYYTAHPDIPVERRLVRVGLLGILKSSDDDDTERNLEVRVTTPDDQDLQVVPVHRIKLNRRIKEAPGGNTLCVDLHIRARRSGTHVLRMLLDGEEVARTSVTLLERSGTDPV